MDAVATTVFGVVMYLAWLGWSAALSAIDIAEHRLPDRFTLPAYPMAIAWVSESNPLSLNDALVGAILCIAAGLAVHRFADLGFGDVKLLGVVGLLVGGSGHILSGIALAAVVAGIHAFITMVRTSNRREYLAFGPSLLAATFPAAHGLAA